jgi:hypothetical protein
MDRPINFCPEIPNKTLDSVLSSRNSMVEAKQATQQASDGPPKPPPPPPPTPAQAPMPKIQLRNARAAGNSFGAAFARLNGETMQRTEAIGDAVSKGIEAAHRKEAHDRWAMTDEKTLRNMGFYGVSRDDF